MSALSCMFNKLAEVKRKTVDSVDEAGETVQGEPAIIYPEIKCYVEPDKGKLYMMGAGQTNLDYKIMICDLYDSGGNLYAIKKGDIVTIGGTAYQVDDSQDFLPPGIPHWEINITGGVL